MTKPIIIDCDPGVDDAVALFLAFSRKNDLNILGITTVGGNVPLNAVTANALTTCHHANMNHIPVHAGCGRPLVKTHLYTAEHVHGKSGLGNAQLSLALRGPGAQHGVDFIIETLHAHPQKVTLVALGPLTNLAMALVKDPSIRDKVEELVFMGGAIYEGNTPGGQAEFNIYNDPHAAHVVLNSGLKTTMIGLETTSYAQLTRERAQELLTLGNPTAKMVFDMVELMHIADLDWGKKGCVLHDVCAVAYVLSPQYFKGKACHVAVEMDSPLTQGRTVVDWHGKNSQSAQVFVTNEMDTEAFFTLLFQALSTY